MRTSTLILCISIALGVLCGTGLYSSDWVQGYESKKAVEKEAYLWKRITADKKSNHGAGLSEVYKTMASTWLGGMDFGLIGSTVSDEMPRGTVKGIHTVGVVCKGKFNWNDEVTRLGLTGSFKKGNADHVIARFSSALSPSKLKVPNSAFKILRDGKPSGNMFGSHQIEAQTTTNWFEWGQCNHVHDLTVDFSVEGAKNAILKNVFMKAGPGNYANLLGVAEVGVYEQNGKKASRVNTPYMVCYQPTKDMNRTKNVPLMGENFGGLTNIGPKTTLYHVYVVMKPQADNQVTQDNVSYIGDFETTDQCTTSNFGDLKLFYKHTYWTTETKVAGKGWEKLPESFFKNDGVEKYEKFFRKEHQIPHVAHRRRLKREAPVF